MDATPSERRKIEIVVEQGKKTMVKEMTQSLAEFEAMPVEVLVRIFKCLPNQDIRCKISMACQKFYKICLDKLNDMNFNFYCFRPKKLNNMNEKNK